MHVCTFCLLSLIMVYLNVDIFKVIVLFVRLIECYVWFSALGESCPPCQGSMTCGGMSS
jgi:hypothetical protein